MPEINRPLSPHIGVYKWQVSNTLSIFHRMTGVVLSLGTLVFCVWIVSAAFGESAYSSVLALLGGPLGMLLLFGWSAAFFYHLSNGIRHLFWDAGYGFDKHFASLSGWFTVIAAAVVTLAFWLGINV